MMVRREALCLLLTVWIAGWCCRHAASADVGGPPSSKMSDLVRQLGSESFKERNQAKQALFELGTKAEPELKKGLKHDDLEIRQRCQNLLQLIRSAEFHQLVQSFLADKPVGDEKLPGWKRYKSLVGDDKHSRALYVEMLRRDKELLNVAENGGAAAGTAFQTRTEEIYKRLYPPENRGRREQNVELFREEVSTLLLLSADPKVSFSRTIGYHFFQFFQVEPLRGAMKGAKEDPLRRLLVAWLHNQNNDFVIEQLMRRSINLPKEDLLKVAMKLIKDAKRDSRGKAYAFTILGQNGEREHAKLLEPYLKSTTSVAGFGIGNGLSGQTEVRDVALAMILHLRGEQHSDYGFTYTQSPTGQHLQFQAAFLGFSNKADRDAAFDKWEKRQKELRKKDDTKEQKG